MKRQTLFLLISCVFVSCKALKKTTADILVGITKPKIETTESIMKSALFNKFDTNKLHIFNDFQSFLCIQNGYLKGIPDIIFFDSTFKHIKYTSDSIDCNAGGLKLCKLIQQNLPLSNYVAEYDTTLSKNIKRISQISSKSQFLKLKQAKFHVYIFWAKYVGSLNRSYALKCAKILSEVDYVDLFIVNMDFNKKWDIVLEKK